MYIQNTSVGNDVRNNSFVNSLENTTGVSTSYAIATDATSSPFAMINNNAYCVSGNEGILGFYNASNITTLAAWQTATTQDAQSILLCPVFVSNTDLHLTSASTNAPYYVVVPTFQMLLMILIVNLKKSHQP
ncbi:MAG: hypothetical protein IPO94_18285 [Saprospiraceae bacterium]|nr:hypothetical protein [Saprospiraceae bacterium]